MVSGILIPEIILEEIVSDGREMELRSAEAAGFLVGVYDRHTKMILILEGRRKRPRITLPPYEPDLVNLIHRIAYIPRDLNAAIALMNNDIRTRFTSFAPAIVSYHTQESDKWSQQDEYRTRRYNIALNLGGIKYAHLLYSFEQGKPFVRDGFGKDIPVSILTTLK